MRRKSSDRHLGPPAEANRDKHINFVALENHDLDPAKDVAHERGAPRRNKNHPVALKRSLKHRGR